MERTANAMQNAKVNIISMFNYCIGIQFLFGLIHYVIWTINK